MRKCLENQELISRLLDGELDQEQRAALEAHIEGCEACAGLYRTFRQLSQSLEQDLEEAPEGLREKVMARLRREQVMARARKARRVQLILGAAACLALVLGLSLSGLLDGRMSIPGLSVDHAAAAVSQAKAPDRAAGEAQLFAVEEAAQADRADGGAPLYELSESVSLAALLALRGDQGEAALPGEPGLRLLVDREGEDCLVCLYPEGEALCYSLPDGTVRRSALSAPELDAWLAGLD